ncbi:MAG: hypothetical protein ACTSQO_01345 [Candidatus Helarchaeota archaeon]
MEILSKINQVVIDKFIKCVIISTANILGPTPQFCFPPQDENFQNIVAMKSLILLAGNQDERVITSSIIPISNDFGLVYLFYITHPKGRAGIFDATITIVIDREIKNILIKSIDDLTRTIKNYLSDCDLKLNEEGNIINLKVPLNRLYQNIKKDLLSNSNPIQLIGVGDPTYDIHDLKKSINDLRKLLSNY